MSEFELGMPDVNIDELKNSENEEKQEDNLSLLTTLLCIAEQNYIKKFNIKLYVPILIKLLSENKKNIKTSKIVLVNRSLALILDIVPRYVLF
jgi:hypothetical protein